MGKSNGHVADESRWRHVTLKGQVVTLHYIT